MPEGTKKMPEITLKFLYLSTSQFDSKLLLKPKYPYGWTNCSFWKPCVFQYGRWKEVCNHLEKSCNVQKIQRFVHVMQDFLQNGGLSMIQYDSKIELEYFPFAFFARKNRNEVGSRKTQFLYGCFESIDKISNASELSITSSRSFQRQEIESI